MAAGYEVLFSPIITIRHHYSGQARDEIQHPSSPRAQRIVERRDAMSFAFCVGIAGWRVFSQFRYACKRGWSWVFANQCGGGQALAGIPYAFENAGLFHGLVINAGLRALEFMAQMRCIVATALCRRAFGRMKARTPRRSEAATRFTRALGR